MNLDALFAALDQRPVVEIRDVPGLVEPVYMRALTVQERDDVSRTLFGDKYDKKGVPSSLINVHSVAATLCEADGARLSKDDVDLLVKKLLAGKAGVLDALIARANRVSGSGDAAVEDAEKNSEPTESDASASS